MYHVSAQGIDERMINVHYYYNYRVMPKNATHKNATNFYMFLVNYFILCCTLTSAYA